MEGRGTKTLIDAFIRSVCVFVAAADRGMNQRLRGGRRLAPRRLMILELLYTTGVRNIGEVARFLGVSEAGASQAIDALESRKLLQRIQSRSDRRVRELALTARARKLLASYESSRKRLLSHALRAGSWEDVRRACEFLNRISSQCGCLPVRASHAEPAAGRGDL
jgi:DNA-binding MarR family transcriptional regulator